MLCLCQLIICILITRQDNYIRPYDICDFNQGLKRLVLILGKCFAIMLSLTYTGGIIYAGCIVETGYIILNAANIKLQVGDKVVSKYTQVSPKVKPKNKPVISTYGSDDESVSSDIMEHQGGSIQTLKYQKAIKNTMMYYPKQMKN